MALREQLEQLETLQTDNAWDLYEKITRDYEKALRSIAKDINAWYAQFADITLVEARKLLNAYELEQFKDEIRGYLEKKGLRDEWVAFLESLLKRTRISRIDAMSVRFQQQVEETHSALEELFITFALAAYFTQYYHVTFEIQRALNAIKQISALDREKILALINKAWASDGKNWRERVESDRIKTANELNKEFTVAIIRGDDVEKMVESVSRRMIVSRNNAGRLIMTELAAIRSSADEAVYHAYGVKKYQLIATLDRRTSKICRFMHLSVFPVSSFERGVTAPPFHPHCRTVTVPLINEENPDISLTYTQWHDKYIV